MTSETWFVRRRRGRRYNIVPVSRAGWTLTIGYALVETALSAALFSRLPTPSGRDWLAWGVAFGALTVGYLALVWRTSVPEERA